MPRWFALLLCLLGATIVAVALRNASRARQARGWTRTSGRIVDSRVERDVSGEELMRKDTFAFVIRYAYEVRGQRHESGQVWIGSSAVSGSEDAAWARGWVERFPAGAEVPVWYDPADPRQAVLVRDIPGGGHVTAAVVIGGALVAIGFFVFARGMGR